MSPAQITKGRVPPEKEKDATVELSEKPGNPDAGNRSEDSEYCFGSKLETFGYSVKYV